MVRHLFEIRPGSYTSSLLSPSRPRRAAQPQREDVQPAHHPDSRDVGLAGPESHLLQHEATSDTPTRSLKSNKMTLPSQTSFVTDSPPGYLVAFCGGMTASVGKGGAMDVIGTSVRPLTWSPTTSSSLNWKRMDLMGGRGIGLMVTPRRCWSTAQCPDGDQ